MSTDVDYVRVEKVVEAKVCVASLLSSDAGCDMVSYFKQPCLDLPAIMDCDLERRAERHPSP